MNSFQYKSVCILGRQAAIGRAELESIYGADALQPLGDEAMACSRVPDLARLGGTIKVGSYQTTIPTTDWRTIQNQLQTVALAGAQTIVEGKIQLGLSAYGLKVSPAQLTAAGLTIKKALRQNNYSVRLIPNKELALNSAQVLHNNLTGERGLELLLVRSGNQVIVARTTASQDITAYARRDQDRPKRDARVGMLPPKLAQTIVNMSAGPLPVKSTNVVLDPFCGTGVVLQEALLMGYGAYGTDLEPRMVAYSRDNLAWLSERAHVTEPVLEVGDATAYQWRQPFAAVASETYLGQPLTTLPGPEKLQALVSTCNAIIEHFLTNIAAHLPTGLRLCLAVPAWRLANGSFRHLPLLDHLDKIGYNRVSFEHAGQQDLVYARPNQLVARELLVITRK